MQKIPKPWTQLHLDRFFVIAFVVGLVQLLFFQDYTVFERIMTSSFDMAKFAVMDIALPWRHHDLWLGILSGERAGAIRVLARITALFQQALPEIPKNILPTDNCHNFSANLLA